MRCHSSEYQQYIIECPAPLTRLRGRVSGEGNSHSFPSLLFGFGMHCVFFRGLTGWQD
jgi:hypothetical protein